MHLHVHPRRLMTAHPKIDADEMPQTLSGTLYRIGPRAICSPSSSMSAAEPASLQSLMPPTSSAVPSPVPCWIIACPWASTACGSHLESGLNRRERGRRAGGAPGLLPELHDAGRIEPQLEGAGWNTPKGEPPTKLLNISRAAELPRRANLHPRLRAICTGGKRIQSYSSPHSRADSYSVCVQEAAPMVGACDVTSGGWQLAPRGPISGSRVGHENYLLLGERGDLAKYYYECTVGGLGSQVPGATAHGRRPQSCRARS